MTSTEATRNPTAKEIATAAEALAQEAMTTSQQVLAEVRDLKESGGVVSGPSSGTDPKVIERLDKMDMDIEGVLENLNTVAQAANTVPIGPDGKPLDYALVVAEMRSAFTKHAKAIGDNDEAAHKAIKELREKITKLENHDVLTIGYEGNPPGAHSMAGLEQDISEIKATLSQWDEAGMAPASAEDVGSLHNRLSTLERYLNADGPVAAEYGTASPSNVPAGVPAIYGQVWRLMQLVGSISKDSQADKSMGGYKFRSIEAAMTAVGHALREIGVMFVPGEILDKRIERYSTIGSEYKNGQRYEKTLNWTHVWVTQRYYFVSLIDGSKSEPFEMDGEARDNGDKSTSKADSMRMKYALLQALCIPTEGLPESDGRDGTEGDQRYSSNPDWNRQWEDAASAADEHDRQDQRRRQQQAAEPERGHPVEDEPQTPLPGYEDDRPQDRPMADQKPVDNRTDEEKAQAVVKALRDLASAPPDTRRPTFMRIAQAVRDQHLGSLMVEGITINRHLSTANGTLGGS